MTLYERLEAQGLTLKDVAEQTGLDFSTIWRCFEGDKLPQSKPNKRAVLKVLKWTMADFEARHAKSFDPATTTHPQ